MNERREPDMLDQVVADRASVDPDAPERWASIKLVQDICAVRIKNGMTQAEVAERMGLTQPRVADIERRPWSPSLSRIFAYAQAVGVELRVEEAKAAER